MSYSQDSWIKEYQSSILNFEDFLSLVELDDYKSKVFGGENSNFPFKVTKQYAERIKKREPNDPLLLQIVSKNKGGLSNKEFSDDPLSETNLNAGTPYLKKYDGRALLLLTGSCAIHCKYCFRQNFPYGSRIGMKKLYDAIEKIDNDESIKEVILSGGEPLILTNDKLSNILSRITKLKHVNTIRFHTRMPIVFPRRIDSHLCSILKKIRKNIVIVIHCNHPNELDLQVKSCLKKLKNCDVTLFNQSVLLKDVNDNLESLKILSEQLFSCGVIPYYIHILDQVNGAENFSVSLKKAKVLRSKLTNSLPNYLVPKFVREIPGMKAKIQI